MIVIGMIIFVCSWAYLMASLNCYPEVGEVLISISLIIVSILVVYWDVDSPVEEVKTEFYTSNLEEYGLNVEDQGENKVYKIRKTEFDPVRFGAVWSTKTQYTLILEGN